MAGDIEFTNNYTDLSTDQGFQFEFTCNRCRNGYRTEFDTYELATATNLLDGAGSLLGGFFSQGAAAAERVKSAAWEKGSDKAFRKAVGEIRPNFTQCPRCSAWVCKQQCWNEKKGLCKDCAPDMGVEMAAAQAGKSVEEVWAHAKMSEEDKHLSEKDWREGIVASCPACGAPQETNARFCPQCGQDLKTGKHCTQCGAKLQPEARFCAECGTKAG
jgi:membrane protease subunit (stomatin/prohibitin family)